MNPSPDEDQALKRVAEWAASPDAFREIELAIKLADARAKERQEMLRVPQAVRNEPCTI